MIVEELRFSQYLKAQARGYVSLSSGLGRKTFSPSIYKRITYVCLLCRFQRNRCSNDKPQGFPEAIFHYFF